MSLLSQCAEFTNQMTRAKGVSPNPSGEIQVEFIMRMINDEMAELRSAKDLCEQIDAIIDTLYYILQHITTLKNLSIDNVEERYSELFGTRIAFPHQFISNWRNIYNDLRVVSIDGLATWYWKFQTTVDKLSKSENKLDVLLEAVDKLLGLVSSTFRFLDVGKLWDLVHQANMTKFGEGGYLLNGKWMKPPNFIPPDEKMREEITRQLSI